MTLLATPVAPRHWGTTLDGFGAAAIATGIRGLATIFLEGASSAPSLFSLSSAFPLSRPILSRDARFLASTSLGYVPFSPAFAGLADPSLDQPPLIVQFSAFD